MLKQRPKILSYTAQILDVCTLIVAFFLSFPFRHFLIKWIPYASKINFQDFYVFMLLSVFVWWLFLRLQEVYGLQRLISFKYFLVKILRSSIFTIFTLFAIVYLFKWTKVPRGLIIVFILTGFSCLSIEKYLWIKCLEYLRKKGKGCSDVLIVGATEIAKNFVNSISKLNEWGIRIAGFLVNNIESGLDQFCEAPILGSFQDLTEVLHQNPVDEVIFALPAKDLEDAKEMMEICEVEGVKTRIISIFFSGLVFKADADVIQGIPIITYSPTSRKYWKIAIKRIVDIVISFVALILLSPLFLVIAVLIKMTSHGRIFYEWKLLGLNKKPFTSYKFRTMVEHAEEIEKKLRQENINEMKGVYFKLKKDSRVTPLGRILRKLSIDELPQLYSVIKGDMSLVGPRPVRIVEKDELKDWHRRRFCVRPGVTSPWVVSGKNKINDFDDIARLDLLYIDKWSLWLDAKILLKTIPVILLGKNN